MCTRINSARHSYVVALGVVLASMPSGILAQAGQGKRQDEPPKPIEELAAEFVRDPSSRARSLPGPCPEAGTWQRNLLLLLLENPTSSRQGDALINSQSYNVEKCDIPELDAWFREALASPASRWSVRPLVRGLWHSGKEDNQNTVLMALFDAETDLSLREDMADELIGIPPLGIGPEAALEILAEGYRRSGMAPPPTATAHALRRTGADAAAVAAKRTLIQAWTSRPVGAGIAGVAFSPIE